MHVLSCYDYWVEWVLYVFTKISRPQVWTYSDKGAHKKRTNYETCHTTIEGKNVNIFRTQASDTVMERKHKKYTVHFTRLKCTHLNGDERNTEFKFYLDWSFHFISLEKYKNGNIWIFNRQVQVAAAYNMAAENAFGILNCQDFP